MSKRILFGVDSYFQLIMSVSLRMTLFRSDNADIIVYNSVPSAEEVCNSLRKTKVFQHVYWGNTTLARCGKKYTFWEKFPKYFVYLLTLVAPTSTLKRIIGEPLSEKYDIFIFNGYGAMADCIFNVCYNRNKNVECRRIEDSYASYFTVYGSVKGKIRVLLEKLCSVLFNRKDINNYIRAFYFAEPDLVQVKMPYPVIQAPKIDRTNKELVNTLNSIFNYKDVEIGNKNIFLFEDGRLFFDNNDEEVDIIAELIKFVPNNRFAIKMHPRRKENRFENLGVDIMKGSGIPWEVIQLNVDFSGSIFLTTTSAPIFSSDVYFGDKCHKILLYKCLKKPLSSIDSNFEAYIKDFKKKFGEESLYIPESYDELRSILKKLI